MADNTSLPALLEQHRDEIKTLLPKYLDLDRFINNARTVANDYKLKDCSIESIFRCCMEAARKGWEVGGPEKHCAVAPFKSGKTGKSTAILLPQWQGRAFTWSKSGAIRKLKADVVYTGDHFEIESGDEDRIVHRPDFAAARSPKYLNTLDNIVGAYAIAWLASGERVHAFVSRSQIARTMENVKKKNDNELGFGWTDWLPEMCKKTAIHRLNGIIQPPPEMTPEQLDAWQRAGAAEAQFDAETTGEELPDDLPTATVVGKVEIVKDPPATPPPGRADKPVTTATQRNPPPPATVAPADTDMLYDLWKQKGNKMSALSGFLMENFQIEDAEELQPDQMVECIRLIDG